MSDRSAGSLLPCVWPGCSEPSRTGVWCKPHAVDEADRRFRRLIKNRDPRCRHCGNGTTDCAHIVTRGRWPTRWDPDNAVGLCRPCHVYFTDHPDLWREWVLHHVFDDDKARMGQLDDRSTATERGYPKVDLAVVLSRLEEVT